jgi:hypothetical protein
VTRASSASSASSASARRRLRRAVAAITVVLGLLAAREAEAAPADVNAAHQWFARGIEAARAGDLPAARRAFGAAYALVPSVDILWNLAAVERKSGDSVGALEHLRQYVASPESRADRQKIANEELLPELEAACAHLALSEPDGTIVLVDGKQVASTSIVDLAPGIHAVTVQRDGGVRTVPVDLAPALVTHWSASAAPSADGPTHVPPLPAPAPSASPAVAPAWAAPAVGPSSRTPAVVALGSAAVVSIAAGVYFAFAARNAQETSDRLEVQLRTDDLSCRRSGTLCDDYDSARSAAQRNGLLGTTLLVSGGILGGTAIATWLLWPSSATRFAPTAAKDSAGVVMSGRF